MKKLVQSLFILLFAATTVMAQERTITGTVTSAEDGLPLPGVAVSVKGTTIGTQTNGNGQYSLRTSVRNPILVFSFIGTKTQELAVPASNVLNVKLEQDAEQLSEVVVVGYGVTTKEAFTGSAKVVSAEALDRKNISNVSQALAGEIAGVRVINPSGQPGTEATIRIRGFGSVNGNRDPLYVVDGVPFTGSLNSINPSDILSTTVLKDAAATSIYGTRGANGVVLITTRNGKGKDSFIEVDANFGSNMDLLPRYNVIKSPEQYIALGWEGLYNFAVYGYGLNDADAIDDANSSLFYPPWGGIHPRYNMWSNVTDGADLIDPLTRSVKSGITRKYDPENWEDYMFQSSGRKEVNLKFGGSSDKTNYYTSFGYLDDKGYSVNTNFKRFSARVNLDHEVKPWLTAGFNLNYAKSEKNDNGQSEDSGSTFWLVDNMPPIYPLFLRDANGQIVIDPIFGRNQFDYGSGRGFAGLSNAFGDATYNVMRHNRHELNGNASLNFKIIEGLTFENRLGVQFFTNKEINRYNKYYGFAASSNGRIVHETTDLFSYNLLNLLRYNKSFGDHNLEVLAAHEATDWSNQIARASGSRLVDPDILSLNNAVITNRNVGYEDAYTLESFFGQANYSFSNKYFLSGTVRRDGSSRFRKDKWGTFGSVGAGWLITREDFMSNQNLFKSLKLKASYGIMGDQGGVGYYSGYDLLDVDNLNDNPAFAFDTKGNPDLTWEKSRMFQTGVEFDLGQYLTGSIEYYIKNTKDLIFDRRIGPSVGYAIVQVNDGNLRNQGLEFELTSTFVKKQNYHIGLNINGETFKNKLTKMPIDPATGLQKPIDVQSPYGWSVGHSIFDFYMREWAGVDPNDGAPTWSVHYIDANGNGVFDGDDAFGNPGEQIVDLVDFISKNPDQVANIKQSTTKSYSEATQQYVGKSAIPDIRGAVNLFGGYKGFELNVQMLYSFGGYAYDGNYAALMHSGQVGSNNWHTDILNRWQSASNQGDGSVPRLSNNLDSEANRASTRFLTKANYFALNNIRLGYTIPANFTSRYGIAGASIWVSGDNLWIHTSRKGFNPSTSEAGFSNATGSQTMYQYAPLSTISAGLRVKL